MIQVKTEKIKKRKWGKLREIVVYPPYRIIKFEKVKEIRARDSLIAHYKLPKRKKVWGRSR